MKSTILRRAPLVVTALIFSILTCYGQKDPSDLLEGDWTKNVNEITVTFSLLPDNKYQVEFVDNGSIDVWGSYKISGTQITFNDEGGDYSADVAGVYEFEVDDTSMIFKEIDDPVEGRRMLVQGNWSRAADVEK